VPIVLEALVMLLTAIGACAQVSLSAAVGASTQASGASDLPYLGPPFGGTSTAVLGMVDVAIASHVTVGGEMSLASAITGMQSQRASGGTNAFAATTATVYFKGLALTDIVTAAREFPITSRVDVQTALEDAVAKRGGAKLLGIHSPMNQETPTMAHLLTRGPFPMDVGPLQQDEVDVGDAMPVRCLKNGLWLPRADDVPFAILLSPLMRYGQVGGVHVEIAVSSGELGARLSEELFRDIEVRVGAGTHLSRPCDLAGELLRPIRSRRRSQGAPAPQGRSRGCDSAAEDAGPSGSERR
jgi:hypothetical protein